MGLGQEVYKRDGVSSGREEEDTEKKEKEEQQKKKTEQREEVVGKGRAGVGRIEGE